MQYSTQVGYTQGRSSDSDMGGASLIKGRQPSCAIPAGKNKDLLKPLIFYSYFSVFRMCFLKSSRTYMTRILFSLKHVNTCKVLSFCSLFTIAYFPIPRVSFVTGAGVRSRSCVITCGKFTAVVFRRPTYINFWKQLQL